MIRYTPYESQCIRDYGYLPEEPEEERDPAETTLEETPEALEWERIDIVQWAEDERARVAAEQAWAWRLKDQRRAA